jgi:RimJ/RimL family protein N-acetyltransferase
VTDVVLRSIDDEVLDALLRVAVDDADPDEVLPPVEGPPGWTAERRQAFRQFHLDRRAGFDGPHRQIGWAIVADGEVVGFIRLRRLDGGDHDFGAWIGRSHRGRGVGMAALRALRTLAADLGASGLVAETTSGNTAALALLRHHGADVSAPDADGVVRARLPV